MDLVMLILNNLHHYTNYNCVNEFQTYNSQNVLIKEREFNKELVIFNKTVKISASKKFNIPNL